MLPEDFRCSMGGHTGEAGDATSDVVWRNAGIGGSVRREWWNDRCFRGVFVPEDILFPNKASSWLIEPDVIEDMLAPENRFPRRLCCEDALLRERIENMPEP